MKRFINTSRKPQGFTLIELIFALTIFTFFMIFAFQIMINIIKIYEMSNTSRNNQEAARSVVETISREVNYASDVAVQSTNGANALCVTRTSGSKVLFYVGDPTTTLTPGAGVYAPKALFEATSCTSPTNPTALTNFNIGNTSASSPGVNMLFFDPKVTVTNYAGLGNLARQVKSVELTMTISQTGQPLSNNAAQDAFAAATTIHTAFFARNSLDTSVP